MQIKKILVAHDFSEPANRALVYAHSLACRLSATLEVVHVHPDVYDAHGELKMGTHWSTVNEEQRYVHFLEEELARVVRAALAERADQVVRHVVRGEPVKGIESMAADIGADLICIGSTGKGAVERVLLGSISQKIVRTSAIPVLSVH